VAPAAPDRALRARTAMIGRDPLGCNRAARAAWTSSFAADEDEESAPRTQRWKSWREA